MDLVDHKAMAFHIDRVRWKMAALRGGLVVRRLWRGWMTLQQSGERTPYASLSQDGGCDIAAQSPGVWI